MADEVELKLELTAAAAELIGASALLPGDGTTAQQTSIYFDTPANDLQRAGFTLRIRRSNGKRVQTVKADGAGAAGLFARSEWERAVRKDVPIIDDATPLGALLGASVGDLAPVFRIDVERTTWDLHEGDALIEMVLDCGYAVVADRRSPICEIELELKQGDPDALFALAKKIDAIAPVRLGVLTKSERGYRLTQPTATVFKAEPVRLNAGLTAAQAFQKIVQNCLRQYRLNETVLFQERSPEALHQARVGLRRLRSAFSIFRALLGTRKVSLTDDLRWLASELGDARNIDVLLDRSEKSGALHDCLKAASDNAYAKVEAALQSERVRTLMLALVQFAANGDWLDDQETRDLRDQPVREYANHALDRLRRRVKKDGRNLAKADDETRHELRKDAKKLRYAAEFFVTLYDRKPERRRNKRFVGALEQLQDQLGLLNDLATAPVVLEALGLAHHPDASMLLAKASKKKLLDAADNAHGELIDTKPFWR